jgi:hypothetical protein
MKNPRKKKYNNSKFIIELKIQYSTMKKTNFFRNLKKNRKKKI